MENDMERHNTRCGLEVEFVRNSKKNLGAIKKELQKLLGVKINIEKSISTPFFL